MKNILRKILIKVGLLKIHRIEDSNWVALKNTFLGPKGWLQSWETGGSVDCHGNPIPWLTYASIAFIEKKLQDSFTVFEFGSGNSTLWLQSRVKKVVSIEHDLDWFEKVSKEVVSFKNINYSFKGLDTSDYEDYILEFHSEFDIVIIDGRKRVNCAKNCLTALKEGGIIIWDNTDRKQYREGIDYLLNNGFKKIDFQGIGPLNHYFWDTTIFYKEINCFNI